MNSMISAGAYSTHNRTLYMKISSVIASEVFDLTGVIGMSVRPPM
jgi:hypothetical protein